MTRRVLTIEANDSARDLLCRCLGGDGYEVVGVRHGVEAVREMHRALPDLLLIDQDVPAGGVRTARILRLNPKFRPIPVLVTIPGERCRALPLIEEGRAADIENFVAKPYTPSVLVERVAKELGREDHKSTQPDIVQIREEIRSLSDLPVMPHTHAQILDTLSKEDKEVDVDRLVRLIESEPSLVATILKIARSACYGFSGSLVRGAVTYLGIKRLRPIVHAATVLNIFEDGEEPGTEGDFNVFELWRHSVACGVVMGMISREVRGRAHFLLGLLHDIGKVILNHKFHDYFKEVLRIVDEEKRSVYDVEKEILGITHADVGHILAAAWQLPPEVVISIAHHHRPSEAQMHKRLGALVHVSDIVVRRMEIGNGGDPLIPEMDPYAARMRVDLDSFAARKEEIVQQVDSIVSIRESKNGL